MEHISTLINTASLTVRREESNYDQHLNPHVADIINKLFTFFYGICRGFDKQYQDPKRLILEKTQWIIAFTDSGLNTLEKIQPGLKKCRFESPINTPSIGQFVKWCLPSPENMGLLTKERAFNRATEFMRQGNLPDLSAEQNMILRHAIQESDSFFLKTNPLSKTQPIFYRNYEISVREFIKGDLKPISKAIEDKLCESIEIEKQRSSSRDFGHLIGYEQCMPVIRQMLGMNSNGNADGRGMQGDNQKAV